MFKKGMVSSVPLNDFLALHVLEYLENKQGRVDYQ